MSFVDVTSKRLSFFSIDRGFATNTRTVIGSYSVNRSSVFLFSDADKVLQTTALNGFRIRLKITKLVTDKYTVIEPIPVHITMLDGEAVACVTDQSISMSGDNCSEALQELRYFIEDFCDLLNSTKPLGPEMQRSLSFLRQHVVENV